MTLLNYLGCALLASPFVGIFALSGHLMGIGPTIGIFAVSAAIIAVLAGGAYLLSL